MRVPSIFYSTSVRRYQRKSVYKIYRKTENGWKVLENVDKNEIPKRATNNHNHTQQNQNQEKNTQIGDLSKESKERLNHRENEMKIQMLSKSLYEQIFKNNHKNTPDEQTIKK